MTVEFVVEAIYEIKGRGPCITRSKEAASAWPRRGEEGALALGDILECGDLQARVRGLEYFAIPGPQLQQSILLGDIDREHLEVGQVWRRALGPRPVSPCSASTSTRLIPSRAGPWSSRAGTCCRFRRRRGPIGSSTRCGRTSLPLPDTKLRSGSR